MPVLGWDLGFRDGGRVFQVSARMSRRLGRACAGFCEGVRVLDLGGLGLSGLELWGPGLLRF